MPLPPHRRWDCGGPRRVVALHCSLAHAGEWSGLAGGLQGVTLIAPDLPGHGAQPPWDGRSDDHAEAVRQAVALIGAEGGPVDLIGHSWGGTIALRLALERPELLRSLVLVEPVLFAAARAAGDPGFPAFVATHKAVHDLAQAGRLAEAAALFHQNWGGGERFEDLPARTQAYMTDRMALVLAQNPVLLGDAAGLLRAWGLESLGLPVLLVEGDQSPPVVAAIQAELARRLPMARREVVAGAGHMLPVTHAADLAALVMARLPPP